MSGKKKIPTIYTKTLKQSKFLRLIPSTNSLKEASVLAGYSPKSSTTQIIKDSPFLQEGLQEMLNKNDLSLNKTLSRLKIITRAGLNKETLKRTASVDTTLKAIDTTLKLHRVLEANIVMNSTVNNYTLTLQSMTDTELQAEYAKLNHAIYNSTPIPPAL